MQRNNIIHKFQIVIVGLTRNLLQLICHSCESRNPLPTMRFSIKCGMTMMLLFTFFTLSAQNIGTYKYIVAPFDSVSPYRYYDMLEINNRYYVLSNGLDYDMQLTIEQVTVFDENFNPIEHVKLFEKSNNFSSVKFFLEQDTFYIFGFDNSINSEIWELCLAKFDKDFNLVQPVSVFGYYDLYLLDILKTRKNDFILHLACKGGNRLMHINNKGEVLQEVLIERTEQGSILETDSHYIINFWGNHVIGIFNKDSLEKYEYVNERAYMDMGGATAVMVNNLVIKDASEGMLYPQCGINPESGLPLLDLDRAILFLDNEFKTKDSLIFGKPCLNDVDEQDNMHYINPDSIYYAYSTYSGRTSFEGSTISIACFSSGGKLHFNHALDLPDDSINKNVLFCRALSNGGALIGGIETDFFNNKIRGLLIYYHPTKNVNNVKEYTINATERHVFPNPAKTHFIVTNTENASLRLYNMVGQEVLRAYGKEENTVIDVNSLPQGVYVLKVMKDNNPSVHKIQIVR